jgi:hypothetical protein
VSGQSSPRDSLSDDSGLEDDGISFPLTDEEAFDSEAGYYGSEASDSDSDFGSGL